MLNLQSDARQPERFKFELTRHVARAEEDADESLHLSVGRLTIFGPFPDEREWRELHRQLRRRWNSPALLGELRTEEEVVLDRLLAEHGPRPKSYRQGGQGLQAYWEGLLHATQPAKPAKLTRWKSWKELRQFVERREKKERERQEQEAQNGEQQFQGEMTVTPTRSGVAVRTSEILSTEPSK